MVSRLSPEAARLLALEQQIADLNRRTMDLSKGLEYHDARIIALESAEQLRRIAEAREMERDIATQAWRASVENNFKLQTESAKASRENLSKLFWLVASALVVAFVGFVVKGGLTIP